MMVIGIILIIAAVFLIVAVLMQHGKSHNLSGTIAGASESFFGKTKASTMDHKLSILTTVVAIIFVLLVLITYLMQDNDKQTAVADTTSVTETTDASKTDGAADTGETAESGTEAADTTGTDTAGAVTDAADGESVSGTEAPETNA